MLNPTRDIRSTTRSTELPGRNRETFAELGAGERIRTADLPLTRRMLCLLSYTGGCAPVPPDAESLPGYRLLAGHR
jgi:hypothetical protein